MATENTNVPESSDGAGEELSLRDEIDLAFDEVATDEVSDRPATEGRSRDASGRFAPKHETDSPQVAQEGQQTAQIDPNAGRATQTTGNVAAAPQTQELKAPVSWRPEIREKWGRVDPEVRAEIARRESELGKVLQSSAGQRQFVEAFEKIVGPYEMFIRAENSNPLQAVDNMMRTAAELRVGTPASKANLVAGIIRNFGVDLQMLDGILAGQAPQHQAQVQANQFRDPRVDQMIQAQQAHQQQQARFEDEAIRQGLGSFAQTHEFYRDVAALMADIVEVETRQGRGVDLEKVYAKACQMHDGVSTILSQRASAQSTQSTSRAVLRAKRAAASVKGDPTPNGGATVPKNDSLRAAIEAAIENGGDR
jgi:hypothetical protein